MNLNVPTYYVRHVLAALPPSIYALRLPRYLRKTQDGHAFLIC